MDTDFLRWLQAWYGRLPQTTVERPEQTAVVVVDMVNGFCKTGNLASDRVGALINPVVELLQQAHNVGVQRYLIAEDTHQENDKEFTAFPPHCVRGTGEEKTVDEIRTLPFSNKFNYFSKPTLNISVGTDMDERLRDLLDSGVDAFVIAGDCTDFCVYQAAAQIRFTATAHNKDARILVPADVVNTYDLTIEQAESIQALPHPGDLLHRIFLYHLALIGCEVVASIQWAARD